MHPAKKGGVLYTFCAGGVQAVTVKRVTLHVLDITAVDLVQIYKQAATGSNGPTGLAGNGTECSGLLRLHTESAAAETRAKQGRNGNNPILNPVGKPGLPREKSGYSSGVTEYVVDKAAELAIMTLDGWQHRRPSRA